MKFPTRTSFSEAVVDVFTSANYKGNPLDQVCALENQESGCTHYYLVLKWTSSKRMLKS